MKNTDLKHLTHKTAFLLGLASGKRRSKIHAWVANKVSNLGQWEKGCFIPFFRFQSQKPTSKRRFSSVSRLTIPALTTIVDRHFKEDRTLCPVRALIFYLDRTKALRESPSLRERKESKSQGLGICLPHQDVGKGLLSFQYVFV